MRIERTYWLQRLRGEVSERSDFLVHCQETQFCEDPACEARHEDPTALWDTRTSFIMCEAYGRERAERIIDGLKASDHADELFRLRVVLSASAVQARS